MDEELSPLDERLETQQQAIREKLAVLEPDLPPLPEPEVNPKDEGWSSIAAATTGSSCATTRIDRFEAGAGVAVGA